jgi:hypothetical protein
LEGNAEEIAKNAGDLEGNAEEIAKNAGDGGKCRGNCQECR